jgi:S1-C subfamily serine protease
MRIPRPPHWLIYTGLVAVILFAASWRQQANAPEAPPPVPGAADMPIAPSSPFAHGPVAPVRAGSETASGTAFSIGDGGVWLTARHVLDGCSQSAIMVAEGRGVAAHVSAVRGDVAVLTTDGGSPSLTFAIAREPRRGQMAFHLGYPQGRPGEAASRLLGQQTIKMRGRGVPAQTMLAWVEVGRTDGLNGALAGLSGAPVLDGLGQVVGVTLAESPRRGRIYSTTPQALREALTAAGVKPAPGVVQSVTTDNYGRVADSLRRDLRVAQVVCLAV